jgi:uncharacterized protein YggT (Ycf19 family)
MDGRFGGIDIAVLVVIMVLVLMARFSGLGGGWRPGGPFAR